MKQAENHTIYTIGHSTHSFAEFLEMLRSFDIKILVDIRSMPGSRKFPQFDQENLKTTMENLEYTTFTFPIWEEEENQRKTQKIPDGIILLLQVMPIIWKRKNLKKVLKN